MSIMTKGKWLVLSTLVFIAGFAWFSLGKQAKPIPAGSISEQMLKDGVYAVDSFDIELTDSSRPTNPNADYAGDKDNWYRL